MILNPDVGRQRASGPQGPVPQGVGCVRVPHARRTSFRVPLERPTMNRHGSPSLGKPTHQQRSWQGWCAMFIDSGRIAGDPLPFGVLFRRGHMVEKPYDARGALAVKEEPVGPVSSRQAEVDLVSLRRDFRCWVFGHPQWARSQSRGSTCWRAADLVQCRFKAESQGFQTFLSIAETCRCRVLSASRRAQNLRRRLRAAVAGNGCWGSSSTAIEDGHHRIEQTFCPRQLSWRSWARSWKSGSPRFWKWTSRSASRLGRLPLTANR